jgi:hypothetical protein
MSLLCALVAGTIWLSNQWLFATLGSFLFSEPASHHREFKNHILDFPRFSAKGKPSPLIKKKTQPILEENCLSDLCA